MYQKKAFSLGLKPVSLSGCENNNEQTYQLLCVRMSGVLVSDIQFKLAALLSKSKDLIPFASESDCEKLVKELSNLAKVLLARRERRHAARYGEMTLEDLLGSGLAIFPVFFFFFPFLFFESSLAIEARNC